MIGLTILLVLLPVLAAAALTQRRRSSAIIAMGLFSFTLAGTYFLLQAPDVAITESAIGAALVTSIYVLAIRKTGQITVVASEAPGLLQREADRITGLEWEILERVARTAGLDLSLNFAPNEDVIDAVRRGDADVAAGGVLSADCGDGILGTGPHLPTARYAVRGPRWAGPSDPRAGPLRGYFSDIVETVRSRGPLCVVLDLARFLALSRYDLSAYDVEQLEGSHGYTFGVSAAREDLHRHFAEELARMRESGELDRMIARYFP